MKFVQVGALASALLALSARTYGYEFSSTAKTTVPGAELNNDTGLSINQESRIYGGSEADVGQYPFIASLRFKPDGKTFCGGTLVAPQFVLTAGHCIKTDKGQIYVSLGSGYGSGPGSGSAKQMKVAAGFRHPLYFNSKHRYDVGLLKLETPSRQKPAKLRAGGGSDNEVGKLATVLGWGLTEDRKGSFTLQGVNVGIISNAECNKEYGNRITEEMMCAGNGNGRDSCNGDSGGPLLADGVLVGLVSWGGRCGAKAGVYTRLSAVMEYIEGVLIGDTDSTYRGTSPMPGSSATKKLTPKKESREENTMTGDEVGTAAEASTTLSLDSPSSMSSSSSENAPIQFSLTPKAPDAQLSMIEAKTDTPTNAPNSGCAVRRHRSSSV